MKIKFYYLVKKMYNNNLTKKKGFDLESTSL